MHKERLRMHPALVIPRRGIVSGYLASICLDDDGKVRVLGDGDGCLGKKSSLSMLHEIIAIDCGEQFVICLDSFDNVWGFGENSYCQLGVEDQKSHFTPIQVPVPPMKSIVCGGRFTLCIDMDNSIWSFGHNHAGQCGRPNTTGQKISGNSLPDIIEEIPDIIFASAAGNQAICMDINRRIYGFGDNAFGQLGINYPKQLFTPQEIELLPENITNIACGWSHTTFLTENKEVYTYKLEDTDVQLLKIDLPPIDFISCTNSTSLCVDEEGFVWTFGKNNLTLGFGDEKDASYVEFKPRKIPNLENINMLSRGGYQVFSRDVNGKYYSWGMNTCKQLGRNGSTLPAETFSEVWDWIKENEYPCSRAKSAKK